MLFDEDAPGMTVNTGIHTGEMYVNFVQYVTLKVCGQEELCSNEAPWSYQLRIDIDKTEENVELNQLKTSPIDLPDEPYYEMR